MDTSKVTRFEVIDHSFTGKGREFVRHGVTVEFSVQDNGKTLKVFLRDSPLAKREDVVRDMNKGVAEFIADRMNPGGPYNDPSTSPPMGD